MRLTFELGPLNVDFSLTVGASEDTDHRGDVLTTQASTSHNGWEKHPNGYDEPGEGDERVRLGFR